MQKNSIVEPTVLIVDDDPTIVRLCQRLLERASYRVITATDPLDGLRVLKQLPIDLLLSDIRMPVMDGFELISQAKYFQPDLSVLVMTGYGSIENAIQALHRGVDGLLLKPFENSAELVQAVHQILEESRQKRDAVRMHALRPLFDVTERLLAETSFSKLEKLIIETVTGLLKTSFACIYRVDFPNNNEKTCRALECTSLVDCAIREEMMEWLHDWQGGPEVINASGPGSALLHQPMLQKAGLVTLMVAPVQRTSHFVFCAGRETAGSNFTEADLEMFVILARQAAVALENARLYSELKAYVLQVEESHRALIQAEKMAAVGRLVASLAHEINNPLQAVRNCLHLASRKGLDNEQRFQYLEMTENELERLVQTVRGMLDFYRPASHEKEQVDICMIVEQVLALLRPQLQDQNIRVHVNRQCGGAFVYVVPSQIQQVIFNLIINAVDALEENNGASANSNGKDIWVDIYYSGQQVGVAIEDSGPGIPEELQGQVFEPFVSTKKNGTGLGLAVSYGIVERHHGRLSLVSPHHASGASFEILLPIEVEEENDQSIDCG